MSYNRGQVKDLAWTLANDPSKAVGDTAVNTYFDEIYARYGVTILAERVRLLGAIAVYANGEYDVTSAVAGILSIDSVELANDSKTSRLPVEKDEYYSVISDSENGPTASLSTLRWGAVKLQNSAYHKIAIFPPASGALTLYGWGRMEVTKLTTDSGAGTSELDCTDVDAVNIARLLAAQIMSTNGESQDAIQAVVSPVGQSVLERMNYIRRQVPRTNQQKDQL